MHKLYELKEMLMKELSEYGAAKKLDANGLDVIDKLAHAIKNICKIIDEEDPGYSSEPMTSRDGMSQRRSYEISRMARESYARGRGPGARRDAMGRYSSDGGYSGAEDEFVDALKEIMRDLPEAKKRETQRFIERIEGM